MPNDFGAMPLYMCAWVGSVGKSPFRARDLYLAYALTGSTFPPAFGVEQTDKSRAYDDLKRNCVNLDCSLRAPSRYRREIAYLNPR